MRIITERKIREFWLENPKAESVLCEWINTVKQADWNNFANVRNTFNHADIYGNCTIFDVGGNKYRIIGKVAYRIKIVFIRFVLTHEEYDEKKWQDDCK
jgi:mRNA interferase HigB